MPLCLSHQVLLVDGLLASVRVYSNVECSSKSRFLAFRIAITVAPERHIAHFRVRSLPHHSAHIPLVVFAYLTLTFLSLRFPSFNTDAIVGVVLLSRMVGSGSPAATVLVPVAQYPLDHGHHRHIYAQADHNAGQFGDQRRKNITAIDSNPRLIKASYATCSAACGQVRHPEPASSSARTCV